jgi:tripartite ATP-independent transporter DctP family solute receptor
MLKKFRCLALAMTLVLVFVSCTTFAADKPVKLIFGSLYNIDNFLCKSDQYFKSVVEKNSQGNIIIDYFPGAQLGSASEMHEATRANAQQLDITSPADCERFWSKLGSFELPYLFRDEAHQLKVAQNFNSVINPDEMAAKTGLRILSVRIRAPRHVTTKFSIKKLEDLKGIKMRSPQSPLYMALFKAWGTVPTVIPASEMYTALATGVVDAQENPFDSIYTRKTYEQTKYCALTGHLRTYVFLVINEKCWQGLTTRQKKILTDAANKSAKMGIKDCKEDEKKLYNLLVKAGMKFTKPDLTAFREKAKPIWDQYGDQDLIKKIEAIK